MQIENKLSPEQCTGMDDIRAEIDLIDRTMVSLIGKRYQYVLAAAKFKTSATAVRVPERFKAMLEKRRQWAEQEGLSPDAIERMFSNLVTHFIEEEMQRWKNTHA
jgi:isochorismate pyruvate lyase